MFRVLTKALVLKDYKVLLIKRSTQSSYGGGLWDFPGGKLEYGESPEESLKREIREETTINIKILDVLDINSGTNKKKKIHYITIVYLVKYIEGEIRLDSENLEYSWVDIKNIQEYDKVYYVEDATNKFINIYK